MLSGDFNAVRNDLESFKADMPILGIEKSKIISAVKKTGVGFLGGKTSNARIKAYGRNCMQISTDS